MMVNFGWTGHTHFNLQFKNTYMVVKYFVWCVATQNK